MAGLAHEVARAALGIQLPPEGGAALLDRAAVGFADTIGVALAGRTEQSTQVALDWAKATYGPGASKVWGAGYTSSPAGAAYVNGVASHALDFDDVAPSVGGHPSALLVPVLLALADDATSGKDLLEAYLVGIHVTSSIALGFELAKHYAAGWHASVTVGSLGTVAAGCRLLRLDRTQTRNALGIAASTAAGTRENFGSMVKPLHVGVAGANVVMACQLAARGFDASPSAIDGPLGFLNLHAAGSDVDVDRALEALGKPLDTFAGGACTKKYPCCYHAHRALDAAIALHGKLEPDAIRGIRVTVDPGSDNSLIYPDPVEGAQGRFSMQYTVATALRDGEITFEKFEPAALSRPDVRELMRMVEVDHAAVPPIGPPGFAEHYALVEVTMADGAVLAERCDAARGDSGVPLTETDLVAKLRQCLVLGGYELDPVVLHDAVRGLVAGKPAATVLDLIAG